MRQHRNPRKRLAKQPTTHNPPRRRPRIPGMHATFDRMVAENPRLARAVLEVLRIISTVDGPRAMALIEAVSAVVIHSPAILPGGRSEEP